MMNKRHCTRFVKSINGSNTLANALSVIVVSAALLLFSHSSIAASANVKSAVNRSETPDTGAEKLLLPYIFSTDSMGVNLGLGAMASGYYQDQMTVGGTVYGGDVSYGAGGGIWNYQLPSTERFFVSLVGFMGYYPQQKAYASGGDYIPQGTPRPGSNYSSNEQFLQADGSSNWWDIKLEYALPIGATRDKGRVNYELTAGLLTSEPSGGKVWNPLESGATVAVLKQFNRYESYEFDDEELDGAVHAIELGLLYDNTDFSINPSYGSKQYISVSHDAGWLESDHSWTFFEFEASKYFSFGESTYASQRILAVNFWTGYSPSWELEYDDQGGSKANNNPPHSEGANLGGFYRMRGFDSHRFHDKAAIYGTAEYRYTLKYNPIADVNWLKFLRLDWFQLVGFVEAGRVGESYTAEELLTDMKYDYGVSLRALTAGIVVRFDVAQSDENTNAWVMVDHPF
ncbi:BamA/TamA family outer membrane protein [Shewanella olleyana]|uniref:BamA/TamA family outer membrane protein n=1 Tax=Shewanella olleyana TaxID=135626 RepID=UPI00200D6498|nr:BamA/TamA family outer membrane protein [Shewanella olleyana]MCL1067058.1 BamA/TamA family outer membrane protein [Shewanella olleyana]